MDSPRPTRVCFMLLAIAAFQPNIAMPTDNPADSSFGKTTVTVYHCKDCESNVCKLSSYENFAKIGETQSEMFSNETIHLVTSKTHIIMCFKQENTFSEGIYAIVWENDRIGIGDSCGRLNFGASSENVKGDITQICCEAEIDPSVPSTDLKCYTETSGEKTRKSRANIIDEGNPGNPQFSIGEKSSIGVIAPLLVLVVCAAALAVYCVRRNRNGRGRVIVLNQIFEEQEAGQ